MERQNLIGVDVGTTSVRAGVVNLAGEFLGVESESLNLISHGKDHIEQDPDEMLAAAVRVIHRVLGKTKVESKSILGISFDGQMAGVMAVDQSFRPVAPYDSWLDTRCAPYVELMRERSGSEVLVSTGSYPSINHGPKMLWWKEEQPGLFKRIFKFIQPAAYVAGRLANLKGEDAFIDYTYLHFSGFAETEKGKWNADLTRFFSFPLEKLPRIVSPMERVGSVAGEFADRTGLQEGTPIIAGCGDTIASMTGAGVIEPGRAFDVAGTASVFSICVDSFKPDTSAHTLMTSRSVFPGAYYAYAYINGGGCAWIGSEKTSRSMKTKSRRSIIRPKAYLQGLWVFSFFPTWRAGFARGTPSIEASGRGLAFLIGKSTSTVRFWRALPLNTPLILTRWGDSTRT